MIKIRWRKPSRPQLITYMIIAVEVVILVLLVWFGYTHL